MKTNLITLKLLILLCTAFATTAVLSQTSYVWTNQNPLELSAGDLNQGTNWTVSGVPAATRDAGGVPRPDYQDGVTWGDEMLFDGQTTGPLMVTQNGGSQANGAGSGQPYGLRVHLTANQTAPVTIYSPVTVSGGMRMNYFTIDAGSGGLILGDHITGNCLDIVGGVLNGQIFGFTNNSSTPSVINESVRWRMGGAGAHPHVFAGTGDWIVNNHMRSANQSAILVQKDGPGTMTWTGTNNANANFPDALGSPITIFAGTMIWKTSDLVGGSAGNPNIVHNGALFEYDAPVGAGNILGVISGTGAFQMNSGTLQLSGQNTISGNITLSGGTLIAGSTETVGTSGPLGQGGTISFAGGTLAFSANNTFDYSSRFSTAAGQPIAIDTAGQNVTFATGLSSSGGTLTKTGNGELIVTGTSTYSGLTTVNGGTLTFEGAKTGSGNITVADGGTLDIFDTGAQVTPATLTLGTSAGANLEFDNVNSTTTPPLAAGTIANSGTTVISINSGAFHIGNSYPLVAWTSGPAPSVSLGIVDGAGGTLSTNGNKIQFNCTSVAFVWSGANSGTWDASTPNWTVEGSPVVYSDPNQVLFNDTVSGQTNVTISGVVQPQSITVNNTTNPFSIISSAGNNLAGSIRFGKRGSGTLTLSGGANTNTGVLTLRAGTVIVSNLANGGLASDIGASGSAATNIVFNGGALQYAGPGATIDRLFTVGTSGGALDNEGSGPLNLTNPGVISMSGALTLNGNNAETNVLASALISGGGLTKNGTATWVLSGTNSYGGGTVVANGVLQVGASAGTGSLGSGPVSLGTGTTLDFVRTGTGSSALTVPGAISGNGSVSQDGTGTVILANNSTFTGGTTINAGTLQIGNGGSKGSLYALGPIVDNSLLVFNTSGSFSYSGAGLISGTGNVIAQGGGVIKAVGANTYTGWTRIDSGTTFWPREGQDGLLASSAITNNGILRIVSQDNLFTFGGPITGSGRVQIGANNVNVGVITLTGTNTYTGGTFIGGNELVLGDNATAVSGSLAGNVQFVNNFTISQDNPRTLTFNRPDDFTFSGNITTNFSTPQSNLGIVQQNGTGTLTLTGNNTYGGGTVVNGGFLVIGNGGSSGSVGFGPVTLTSGNPLLINRTGSLTIWDNISGLGDVDITGGATVTLNGANNSYSGATWVTNGTLVVNGTNATASTMVYLGGLAGTGTLSGPVTLSAGTTLAPGGAPASLGTLTLESDLSIGGNISIDVNKSLSPANDLVVVNGILTNTGTGTITVKNLGPAVAAGDKFILFSQPVQNGAAFTVAGSGANWVNNLAVDGSISVQSLIPPPTLNFADTANGLQFSWSGAFKLQAQTNRVATGISTNWADYPGGSVSPVTVPIVMTNGTVFFRLVSTP